MGTTISTPLSQLLIDNIDEEQYENKVQKEKKLSDFSYLTESGDISKISNDLLESFLESVSLDDLMSSLTESQTSINKNKILDEIEQRHDYAKNTIEDFINDIDGDVDGYDEVTNKDGELNPLWWQCKNNNMAFGRYSLAMSVAMLEHGGDYSGKKLNKTSCKNNKELPNNSFNIDRKYNISTNAPRSFRNKYAISSYGFGIDDIDEDFINNELDANDKQRKIIYNLFTDDGTDFLKLPDDIIEEYYKNKEEEVLKRACKSADIKQKLIDLGHDEIEDEIEERSFERINDFLKNNQRVVNKTIKGYGANYKASQIKRDLKNLGKDKITELWEKEYEHFDKNDEKVQETISGIFSTTAIISVAWNTESLRHLNSSQKAEIVKEKVRANNNKVRSNSISWPDFGIDQGVFEELTALQLSKFINLLSTRDEERIEDIADKSFYKSKLSKKIFKGDKRAKDAISRIKDIYMDEDEEESNTKSGNNNNSNSNGRSKEGVMIEKAKKADRQISSFIKSFKSFGDMVEYIKEENEDILNTSEFDTLWDSVDFSEYKGKLQYQASSHDKNNIKIVNKFAEEDFHNFTKPEVEE